MESTLKLENPANAFVPIAMSLLFRETAAFPSAIDLSPDEIVELPSAKE